ncbi:MAG TPA: DNA-formamidopyrimidine glycosylase family protein, partial [Pseudonocardia sp.]|uniref:DNA-formamidopyrimidine glycosylase family protein n=1 Tax=Pseudonocardia sp. TaxID=60912 RepID=UPI002F41B402
MPEGDSVFQTAHALTTALAGSALVDAEIRHPRYATVDLVGRTVLEVASVGKHLFVRFDNSLSLHNHLRMDGSWRISAPGERWRAPGHQVRVVLGTARRVAIGVRVHDLALLRTERESELVGHLGPDLLDADWGEESVAEAARRLSAEPGREIGLALLDQTIMAGIGNVYRSELCFLLGVSPWAPVGSIDAERAVRLARKLLLRNAMVAARNTTGDRTPGRQLWVYSRAGRPCLRCGNPVRSAEQGKEVP